MSIMTNFSKNDTVSLSWRLVKDGDSPAIPFKYKRMGITYPASGDPSIN